jgi:hypothetical protein
MNPRKMIRLVTWPDPLLQERIEDMGFFYDAAVRVMLPRNPGLAGAGRSNQGAWVRFCDEHEVDAVGEWLKRHRLAFEAVPARGQGELKRHPRLSEQLLLKTGGSASTCALCGLRNTPCRQWVEGDDTDSTDYPSPARFFLCGQCVQVRMQPHPRLYAPAEDQL